MNTTSYSGLHMIGDIPWGTHFCNFYQTGDDFLDSLVPYFKAGLDNQELCLWVTADPFNTEEAKQALGSVVPRLPDYLQREQIQIIDYHDWYLKSPSTDANTILEAWLFYEKLALAKGYRGLRVSGNVSWLEKTGWKKFLEYEACVNRTFAEHRIIALCSYCLSNCNGGEVVDVIGNHEFALVRREGEWESVENSQLKMAKAELYRLNEALEQRVAVRTKALETALKARDEFISVASHELKTPITSLQLYVQGMIRAQRADKLTPIILDDKLTKVLRQCGQLTELINNLLDITQITSGNLSFTSKHVDIIPLIKASIEDFKEQFQRANCEIKLTLPETKSIYWDPMRFTQVINNLFSNIIKYAPGQPVEISLSQEDTMAVMHIKDGGQGINQQYQKNIFNPFFQLPTGTNRKGFGLGLWIVKQIMAIGGGDICLESELNQGCSFMVSFPLNSPLATTS